jgi:hypothetical protein
MEAARAKEIAREYFCRIAQCWSAYMSMEA